VPHLDVFGLDESSHHLVFRVTELTFLLFLSRLIEPSSGLPGLVAPTVKDPSYSLD